MRTRAHDNRIVLIGCGKSKLSEPASADNLYTGSLFVARRRYAESTGRPWFVISARYGLVAPDTWIEPYDETIGELASMDRVAWFLSVVSAITDTLHDDADPREVLVEIHAGEDYAEHLSDVLRAVRFQPDRPLQGLGIGHQLAWYKSPPVEYRRSPAEREGAA